MSCKGKVKVCKPCVFPRALCEPSGNECECVGTRCERVSALCETSNTLCETANVLCERASALGIGVEQTARGSPRMWRRLQGCRWALVVELGGDFQLLTGRDLVFPAWIGLLVVAVELNDE